MAANQTTVKITADASGYTVELDRARKSAEAFQQTQAQAAERVRVAQQAIAEAATNGSNASSRAINNFVSQLQRTADQAGKTRAEMLQMRAAQLGIVESASKYINVIDSASKSTHEFSLNNMAARRELLVLAHEASQGNWSRFGGSLGVLAERTDALTLLLSPLGLGLGAAAGATALFLMQVAKGREEIEAFNKSITATSGFVGLSAGQMAQMANGLQDSTTRLSAVREAMAEVAATGAFTADNLSLATQAAIAMSSDIGIGTDKAAESLAKIQDDVLKWVTDYQKAHHAFSASQVEEIDNFVKLGDTASATKSIMQDLAKAHAAVEADANAHMGPVLDWWHQLEYSLSRVKDAIRSMGTPDSMDKQVGDQFARVEQAQKRLKENQQMGPFGNTAEAQAALTVELKKLDVLRQQQTVINTQQRAREAAAKGGDAQVALTNYLKDTTHAGPTKQRDAEIAAENEKFAKLKDVVDKGSKEYQQALKDHYEAIAQINSEYAKKTKAHGNAGAFAGQIASMTAANQLIEVEEKRHETQLKASRGLGLIDGETYLTQLAAIQTRALDQEIGNAQRRVDIARAKPESAAYQEALKDLQKFQDQRSAILQSRDDSLQQLEQQRARDVQRFAMQANVPAQQQGATYAAGDAVRYATAQQAAEYSAKLQLAQQFGQKMQALYEQYELDPASDQKAYIQKVQYQQAAYQQEVEQLQQHLAKEQSVRDSYSDQMHLAMVKLGGDGQTYAQMTASAFTTAWQDSSNALDEFITTGKGNFDTFTAGILADLAKIALHQAEMAAFQSIGTSFFSTGGDVGHYADGGAIAGAGTGTSDSIPAMLSNGEYVIRASQARKYHSLLESINTGRMSHFASGGAVGSISPASSSGSGSPVSVVVHNNGGGGLTDTDAKELHALVSAFVDKRMGQAMRGQGGFAYQLKYNQI